MKKITPKNHRVMPWKNGQGSTTELLIEPSDGGLDDFDWRISCATVQTDGDFSSFHGVDRSLLIMSGEGMSLQFNEREVLIVTPESQVVSFAGEDAVHADLLGGTVTDFNVMTRRSRWLHSLEKYTFDRMFDLRMRSDMLLIYHADGGAVQCMVNGETLCLFRHELLCFESADVDSGHIELSHVESSHVESSHVESSHVELSRIVLKSEGQVTLYVVHLKQRT